MDGRRTDRLRLALVDLDARRLDRARTILAAQAPGSEGTPAQVRLVVSPDRSTLPWRWAALAGVPRSGEVAALADSVVDVVLVADESPRADACARLAAALGARVLRLPVHEGSRP